MFGQLRRHLPRRQFQLLRFRLVFDVNGSRLWGCDCGFRSGPRRLRFVGKLRRFEPRESFFQTPECRLDGIGSDQGVVKSVVEATNPFSNISKAVERDRDRDRHYHHEQEYFDDDKCYDEIVQVHPLSAQYRDGARLEASRTAFHSITAVGYDASSSTVSGMRR